MNKTVVLTIAALMFIGVSAKNSFAQLRPAITPKCEAWACQINPLTGQLVCPPCQENQVIPDNPGNGAAVVPEPLTLFLVGGGLIGGMINNRKKRVL